MKEFKTRKALTPEIKTSSLPDIVFILLFFFMVVTIIKPYEQLFVVEEPKSSEQHVVENISLIDHIHIGIVENEEVIQLNDAISPIAHIPDWVEDGIRSRPEPDRNKIIRALHVDKAVKMGIVQEVKQELRKANALKILYSTLPQSK